MKHNLDNFQPNTDIEGDWHQAFSQALDHIESMKEELKEKLKAIEVEQERNNKLLKDGTPIAETTVFYNNGQWRIIKEVLGEDNGL